MKEQYQEYYSQSSKIKQKRIDQAKQSEERKPNPLGNAHFPEYNFIPFQVPQGKNSINLHTYRHSPKGDPVAVIFMFHGLNSHIDRGAHLADYFAKHGFITVGFDHRGFGRSEGEPAYIQSLEAHLKDSKQFLKLVMPQYKQLPKFVLGLSMGGMTSYHLSLQDSSLFDGAVLMAPALKNNLGSFLAGLATGITKILPNKMRLTRPIVEMAAKNPVVSQYSKNDKYQYTDRASLSTMKMILQVTENSCSTFKEYKCPFIVFQGGLDKLVNPDVAFELYENSQTPKEDKEIVFYKDMWHDIWNEEEIFEIMEISLKWMLGRVEKKNGMKNE